MLAIVLSNAYLILALLATFEGPLVAVVCGVGAALGYINPFVAWGILIGGDLLPDLVYYWLGRWGARMAWVRRVATRTRLIRENFLPLEELWRTRLFTTLLSSKLSYAVSPPLMVSAGLSAVPFPRFVALSLVVSIPYLGVLLAAGYWVTRAYGYIDLAGGAAPFILAAVGLVFLSALIFIMRAAHRRTVPHDAARKSNLISQPPR